MEEELFEWKEYDEVDTMVHMFINVTRKTDGKKFDFANINYQTGILEYGMVHQGVVEKYKLSFNVSPLTQE